MILQVIQHCQDSNEETYGKLVGYECENGLVAVNSFAIPIDLTQSEEFTNQRLKYFQDLKFETSIIGWYMKTTEDANLNTMLLEFQYNSQLDFYKAIVLVYDTAKAGNGEFPLVAYIFTEEFMNFLAEEELPANKHFDVTLKSERVFVKVNVKVDVSPLVEGFLAQFACGSERKRVTVS